MHKRSHALLALVLNALHLLGYGLRLMVHRHDDFYRLVDHMPYREHHLTRLGRVLEALLP